MRIANLFQSLVSWALATLLVCVVLGVLYYYHRGDEELRRYVEATISSKCPNHSVSVGSASLIPGEGIRLRDVSVVKPSSGHTAARKEMAFCDEILLSCSPTIQELMEGKVEVKHVSLRGMLLQPTRRIDGSWNLADLIPVAPVGGTIPTIAVANARIEVFDHLGRQANKLTLNNVNATISPYPSKPTNLDVRLDFDSTHFQHATIRATLDAKRLGNWSATGQIENLSCNDALRQALATRAVTIPPMLGGLHAVAQVHFSVAKGAEELRPRFQVRAQVSQGKYEAPRFLSHRVTDIAIPLLECISDGTKQWWKIENGTANYGASQISLNAWGPTFGVETDIHADLAVDDLRITREMVGILPEQQQALWARYQPLGLVDLDLACERLGGKWTLNADAQCKDLTLRCDKFQYPLARCHGTVRFRQSQSLDVDLWAAPDRTWKTNPIHIVANVVQPGKDFTGEIKVDMPTKEWIPLDARVHHAIPESLRSVLSDMAAHGELHFSTTLSRTDPSIAELTRVTDIAFRNGTVKHNRFPYPLQNVSGKLHLTNSTYHFYDFQGRNDSCVVTCKGKWQAPTDNAPSELAMEFVAQDIPCDTELREALPAGPRGIWRELRPSGTIDHAVIKLSHRAGMEKPEIGVVVKQVGRGNDPDRRSLEMQPSWFPLAMDRVTGECHFQPDGTLLLKNIQAEHGSLQRTVKLWTNGSGVFRENGSWEIRLERVGADRVETTPEFIAALPKNLSDALRAIRFQGTLFVNANDVRFASSGRPSDPVQASWNSTINVDNGRFQMAGNRVENLFGVVRAGGRRAEQGWVNSGSATFDSLNCRGVYVTNLTTPWFMDTSKLLIGIPAARGETNQQQAIADVFGGKAQALCQVNFTKDLDFGLNLVLSDFDAGHPDLKMPSQITGRGDANIALQGSGQGTHTLRGEGGIRLRDANLAKLPQIITLVNTMNLKVVKSRPDVFTTSNIDFRIDGSTAYLDRFDLHGGSLSLKGRGWIAMDRRLNLQFYSLLGGEGMFPKVTRRFAGQTSANLLQILVSGTLDNLKWSREMLPGWNELFPDPQGIAKPDVGLRR